MFSPSRAFNHLCSGGLGIIKMKDIQDLYFIEGWDEDWDNPYSSENFCLECAEKKVKELKKEGFKQLEITCTYAQAPEDDGFIYCNTCGVMLITSITDKNYLKEEIKLFTKEEFKGFSEEKFLYISEQFEHAGIVVKI